MKKLITLIAIVALFTGCAVKEQDNLLTKTVKHTVNTPLYVGKVANDVALFTVALPFTLVVALLDNKEVKEEKGVKNEK
jgi:hypothetical protein